MPHFFHACSRRRKLWLSLPLYTEEAENLLIKKRCPKCDTSMDNYLIDENRKLHVCGKSPDCAGYLIEHGQFKIKGYDGPTLECHKCGAEMQLKTCLLYTSDAADE